MNMGTLFSFSLAASVMLLMLFPVLRLLVNRSTAFRFNRHIITSALALSLTLPLLFIFMTDASGNVATVGNGASVKPSLPANVSIESPYIPAATPDGNDWMTVVIAIYYAGIAVLLCREAMAFCRLARFIRKSDKSESEGFKVHILKEDGIAPFSWGNRIFLPVAEAEDPASRIFLHEKVHTEKRHWIDVLFDDMCCILLWYNPFVWAVRRLARLNHEFEADASVISSGIDTLDYQRLLVAHAIGRRATPFANGFASGKQAFRQRVLAMNRRRSSKSTKLIVLLAIPAAIVAGIALSSRSAANLFTAISDVELYKAEIPRNPVKANKPSLVSTNKKTDGEKTIKIKLLPSPLKDQSALQEHIAQAVASISSDEDIKVNIHIVADEEGYVKEVYTDKDDDPTVNAIVDQAVNGIRFEKMLVDGKSIQMRYNIPVTIARK